MAHATTPALAQGGLHVLLAALRDACVRVRIAAFYGVRALGEVGALRQALPASVPTILEALSGAIADGPPSATLAGFAALMPALAAAPPSAIVPVLPRLTEHSRAAAEHDNEPTDDAIAVAQGGLLRAAGFEAFAWLSRAAAAEQTEAERAAFAEHAHAVLPQLLVHADHPDATLRRTALGALGALEPWHGAGLPALIAASPGGGPQPSLVPLMAALKRSQRGRLARQCASCAKRTLGVADTHVRARAALLVGGYLQLQGEWAEDSDGAQVREQAVHQLVMALKDSDAEVRSQAACALGALGRLKG